MSMSISKLTVGKVDLHSIPACLSLLYRAPVVTVSEDVSPDIYTGVFCVENGSNMTAYLFLLLHYCSLRSIENSDFLPKSGLYN